MAARGWLRKVGTEAGEKLGVNSCACGVLGSDFDAGVGVGGEVIEMRGRLLVAISQVP